MNTSSPSPGETLYLNSADEEALSAMDGIGPDRARKIIEARPFTRWSEVERLTGLDPDKVTALRGEGVELSPHGEGPIGEPGSGGSADSPAGNLGRV
ncbi:MAG: helix-hairpin-helix domain-containing protein [Brevundimonas sp.]